MNKKAIEEYENLNFEEARKILKEALDLCASSGLDKHPIKARTHIHLGIVIFAGFKQKELALKQFRKALEIQPDIRLTKSLANPEIQAAFDEALAGGGGDKAEPVTTDKKAGPISTGESKTLSHDPVTQAQQGSAISITATLDPSAGAEKVVLAYRPDGASDFLGREMKSSGEGKYTAEIPASATAGNLVAYYIEAQGKDGQPIAAKGSVADPISVTLHGAGSEERPPRKPGEDEEEEGAAKFYVGLQLGSGFGWMTGNGEVNAADKVDPPGFALAQLGHVAPEIGYFLRPNLMLSLQGRFQLVTGANSLKLPSDKKGMPGDPYAGVCGGDYVCSPANGAIAVLAKVTWFFGNQQIRPFAGIAAGGGQIRHVAPFKLQTHCGSLGNETCVDTVAAGPVLVGPGGGILYNLSKNFGLVLSVNTLLAFTNFTFNIDVNAGLALQL